jgi:hypothetical protein
MRNRFSIVDKDNKHHTIGPHLKCVPIVFNINDEHFCCRSSLYSFMKLIKLTKKHNSTVTDPNTGLQIPTQAYRRKVWKIYVQDPLFCLLSKDAREYGLDGFANDFYRIYHTYGDEYFFWVPFEYKRKCLGNSGKQQIVSVITGDVHCEFGDESSVNICKLLCSIFIYTGPCNDDAGRLKFKLGINSIKDLDSFHLIAFREDFNKFFKNNQEIDRYWFNSNLVNSKYIFV